MDFMMTSVGTYLHRNILKKRADGSVNILIQLFRIGTIFPHTAFISVVHSRTYDAQFYSPPRKIGE